MGRNSLSMGANCRGKGGFTPFKNAQESVPRCALAFAISLQSLEIVRRWVAQTVAAPYAAAQHVNN
ncbi:hypothetical protein N8140_03015 [Octadecabacter sp.]|nr:hypothetical protein [Octadecabacter sp.]